MAEFMGSKKHKKCGKIGQKFTYWGGEGPSGGHPDEKNYHEIPIFFLRVTSPATAGINNMQFEK